MAFLTYPARIVFTLRCSLRPTCHAEWSTAIEMRAGERVPEVNVPDGWHVVDGELVCPGHQILVDDGTGTPVRRFPGKRAT